MQHLQSTLGILAILALAWLISENRRAVNWRQAGIALGVTLLLALIMLKVPKAEVVFGLINDAVNAIATATRAGTSFVLAMSAAGRCRSTSKSRPPPSFSAFRRCRSCW